MIGLSEEVAGGEERVVATGVATFLLAVAVAAATHAYVPVTASPAFLPIAVSLGCAFNALTAFLLASRARVLRGRPLLVLAGGYAFAACALVPYLAARSAESATWFWVWYHAGFALFVVAYVVMSAIAARASISGRVGFTHVAGALAGIIALVTTLVFLTPACELWWPAPLKPDGYDAFASGAVGPGVLAIVALAFAALVLVTRLRGVMHVWLAVTLGALLLDCALTIFGGARYTAGWYAARFEGLCASAMMLLAFLRAIAILFERQAQQASADGLTGLANRRTFDERLVLGASLTLRAGGSLSLLMVDVDHLRPYNERYGHLAGDEALQAVARAIVGALKRGTDVATRYGGEEFAIILPATGSGGAERVAARIREAVRRIDIAHAGSPFGVVTVSIGVSTLTAREGRGTRSAATLVASAGRALLRAKNAGRDRVELADVPRPLTLPDGREVATGSA